MEIWPAIDLRGGKCVRLQQGDYGRETVFGEDPAAMARHWVDLGAERLHLVDLDGARSGRPGNLESITAILEAVDVPCELGGGIRSEEAIGRLLELGLSRLVIGTLAIKEPEWFRRMCRAFPGKLVLGIDARDGRVATDGWLATSEAAATEVARRFAGEKEKGSGVFCAKHPPGLAGKRLPTPFPRPAAIVYTDIATDGMMAGPNVEAMAEMRRAVDVPVVASGGVTTVEDVARLARVPVAGCIIGRALYEGKMTLPEAIRAGGAT